MPELSKLESKLTRLLEEMVPLQKERDRITKKINDYEKDIDIYDIDLSEEKYDDDIILFSQLYEKLYQMDKLCKEISLEIRNIKIAKEKEKREAKAKIEELRKALREAEEELVECDDSDDEYIQPESDDDDYYDSDTDVVYDACAENKRYEIEESKGEEYTTETQLICDKIKKRQFKQAIYDLTLAGQNLHYSLLYYDAFQWLFDNMKNNKNFKLFKIEELMVVKMIGFLSPYYRDYCISSLTDNFLDLIRLMIKDIDLFEDEDNEEDDED